MHFTEFADLIALAVLPLAQMGCCPFFARLKFLCRLMDLTMLLGSAWKERLPFTQILLVISASWLRTTIGFQLLLFVPGWF